MEPIKIERLEDSEIEVCRGLCNELMDFQKMKAQKDKSCFDTMNFDTRMKRSYEHALDSQVWVAKDGNAPVGYVFSTVDQVSEADRTDFPDWAPKSGIGFYPDWVKLPQKIGCLSNLYLKEAYRGSGAGTKLFDETMKWLRHFSDVGLVFVYISNGNDHAMQFYLDHGFTYSHEVFGGFISAAYIDIFNN